MKYLIAFGICLLTTALSAQQKQYLLIIRSKTKAATTTSAEAIKTNIQHWTAWMTELGKNGKIAGGYRPTNDGVTVSADKTTQTSPYIANGEMVSSFLIINATDLDDAKQIAVKCPVLELQGNVEIRAIQNMAK